MVKNRLDLSTIIGALGVFFLLAGLSLLADNRLRADIFQQQDFVGCQGHAACNKGCSERKIGECTYISGDYCSEKSNTELCGLCGCTDTLMLEHCFCRFN